MSKLFGLWLIVHGLWLGGQRKKENRRTDRIGTYFILFFTVIDHIGTVPVFIAVTSKYEGQKNSS
jgi:hypothetical protein